MKTKLSPVALALLAAAATPAFGAIQPTATYDNPESFILGFDGLGSTNNITFNLGSPTSFKNAFLSKTNIFLGNIGADLAAEFGSTWYDGSGGTNLYFGLSGASNNAGGISGAGSANAYGDFNSTVYISRARTLATGPGVAGSDAWNIAAATVTTAATDMLPLGNLFASSQVNNKLVTSDVTANSWAEFNPEAGGIQTSFHAFTDTFGAQTALTIGQFSNPSFGGLSNVEGVIDIYRLGRYTNGGLVGGGAMTAGLGQYLGSIAISQNGDVNFIAAPEPGTAVLALLGFAGLAGLRRRRQAAQA